MGPAPPPGVSLTTASAHAPQTPAPGRAAGSEAGCEPGGRYPSGLSGGGAGWVFKGTSSSPARSPTGPADGEGWVAQVVGIEAEEKQGHVTTPPARR